MECNRDEALRAMEIAERKFALQDYATARKLLLKAQQLYPSFENILRMLAVVDVHAIVQEKAPGTEIDCYQLLQVDSHAGDSIIKKNYRRLALMLHPDKNKSPGAEAAFKLIGEAWAVLSDKTKRSVYDSKRVLSGKNYIFTKAPMEKGENGHSKQHQGQVPSRAANCAQTNNIGSFWTVCPHCKMQYEYYRTYLNFNLKCQKCLKVFVARDIYDVSANGTNRSYVWPSAHAFMFQPGLHNESVGSSFPGSGTAPAAAAASAATGRDTTNNVRASPVAGKKSQTEKNPAIARQGTSRHAKQDLDRENKKRKEEKEKVKGSMKKQQTIDVLLMKKKKKDEESAACHKVEEFHVGKELKKAPLSDKEDEYEHGKEYEEEHKKLNTLASGSQDRQHDVAVDYEIRRSCRTKKDVDYNFDCREEEDLVAFPFSKRHDKTELEKGDVVPQVHKNPDSDDQHGIPVPDSDFYDFDQDRSKKSFSVGQIWAVYDDFDGMPRFYCRITKVLSSDTFGVRMKWLEALPVFGKTSVKISGLSVACGEFKYAQRLTTENEINLFSHVMRLEMEDKDLVKIYPRSGEVWALFKDWDLQELRSSTIDQAKSCNYELVEVLTHFSEEMGVNLVPLVKVDGYKTVFTRQVKAGVKWIPSTELSRFSHMVPSWKIVEKRAAVKALIGAWDLDPAALPSELIHGPAHCNVGR
ncbi:hypothetical protein O6H91_Y394000 [Diphasiastrum complanatum]|nr:hypothetical protein O6H91_Y394000 [Diphasiastrum complanatum]